MERVKLTVSEGVATVLLSDPDRRNALGVQMAQELLSAFESIDGDAEVGVTLIVGEGNFFCAGGDRRAIQKAQEDPLASESLESRSPVYDACLRLRRLRTPSIAVLRGGAVGAGLNLALCADVIISEPGARFIPGFLSVGLHPGGGLFHLLRERVGPSAAAAMGLLGHEITAERAYELGLVWEVFEGDSLVARAESLASQAADNPWLSRMTTASFRRQGSVGQDLAIAAASDEWPQFRSILSHRR